MNQINTANAYLFEELVTRIKEQSEAAGIAVAIVNEKGETQYEKYFGFRDAEKKLPINPDTIFGVASLTKSFTALSIMQLAQQGTIDLDAPVSRYIPEFTNKNQETVRVRHFLSHSAGFYPVHRTLVKEIADPLGLTEEKNGDLAFCEELALAGTKAVAEQLDAQTKESGIIGRPGEYMSYCNDGFGLLSEIVRRYGGEKSFSEYVKKRILKPLGMERSGCEYARPARDENASVLYKKKDGKMTGGWSYYDRAFILPGAGSMKSTISDMKRYLTMYLNYGKTPWEGRLLSMEGIRSMIRPRIEYRPGSFYCYGLSVKMLDDIQVIEHGGSLTGVSSNLSWSYDAGVGVIVLCNTTDVPVSVIADAAIRMYRGRLPLENRGIYQECDWSDEAKKAACGLYRSGEGAQIELYLEKGNSGRLSAKVGGREVKFVMVQENLGIIRNPNKDASVRIFRDEKREVFAVGYGGRMLPRVGEECCRQ